MAVNTSSSAENINYTKLNKYMFPYEIKLHLYNESLRNVQYILLLTHDSFNPQLVEPNLFITTWCVLNFMIIWYDNKYLYINLLQS